MTNNNTLKERENKIWFKVFSENYPYMISFIERHLGDLRTNDFHDALDLIIQQAKEEERQRIDTELKKLPAFSNREFAESREQLWLKLQSVFEVINQLSNTK